MRKLLFAAAVAGVLSLGSGLAMADTLTLFGNTSCGPSSCTLSSSSGNYSAVEWSLSSPLTLSSFTSLSATFTDNAGGAIGGSPRFVLRTSGSDFFTVYEGTPPNFNDSTTTMNANFSGTNLINGTNDSAFGNSGTYQTFDSLFAAYGTDVITAIDFILDGGWATTQTLNLTELEYNGMTKLTATPIPGALPLFATGLAGLGLLGMRRRKRKQESLTPAA